MYNMYVGKKDRLDNFWKKEKKQQIIVGWNLSEMKDITRNIMGNIIYRRSENVQRKGRGVVKLSLKNSIKMG